MSALALKRAVERVDQDIDVALPAEFVLASADRLEDRHVRVRLVGAADAPVVAVLGGISAGRNVCGDGGWWNELAGDGAAIDLGRFRVLGVDFAPAVDQRVRVTPDDQARLLEIALDALGIAQLRAFVGASYGGMVGLALAARAPGRVRQLCVISASHRPSALGAAWRGVQRRIVEYGLANGDGAGGLALARQLAMTTYRSAEEFDERFGVGLDGEGRGPVDEYLEARGRAYPKTMAPERWLSLSEAIDRHNVQPSRVHVPVTLVACTSDLLVPQADIEALANALPRLQALHVISSLYGHDAFLKEAAQIGAIVSTVLEAGQ